MNALFCLNKSRYHIVSVLILGFLSLHAQAQLVRVIDNKGTIANVRNNQVTTAAAAPTSPLEGDIWFDTTTNTKKVWDGVTTWKEIDSWLGNKTTHHNAITTLAISEVFHNNSDIHVESTGDLSITNTDVSDATTFYITNTTAVGRTLSFTGFTAAYLRNGGTITDLSGGLTLKANMRYLAHITEDGTDFYFNATEARGGESGLITDEDGNTKIQVEESTNEDTIRFDTAGTERAVISATGNVGIGNTTPNTNAILDLTNTQNKAFLLPTETLPTNVSTPAEGMLVYSTNNNNAYLRTDSAWKPIAHNTVTNELIFDGDDDAVTINDNYYYVSFVVNGDWKVIRYDKTDVNVENTADETTNTLQTTQPITLSGCTALSF